MRLIYADASFAECHTTRKSTSGGVATWMGNVMKSWAKTQGNIALSTGEAELAAVVRAAAESLGLQSVLADFGMYVSIVLKADATAAIGMVKREGLGRVRHLAVGDLWIQQRIRAGHIAIGKVPGTDTPSDMLTKGLEGADIQRYLSDLRMIPASGRHRLAPKVQSDGRR